MLTLVEQTHEFRRAEKNLLQLNKSKVNFTKLVDELVIDFYYLAKVNHKVLKVEAPEIVPVYLVGDASKLETILNNLLGNAFKFTNPYDTISIRYMLKKGVLECSVTDTGSGISKVDQPYIFDRFFQSKVAGAKYVSGSGIGLAFSKRLVELHNGKIM